MSLATLLLCLLVALHQAPQAEKVHQRGCHSHPGMVLDVTRWLPEHPGGDSIIPAQALDLDCSRFFEVTHERELLAAGWHMA